VLKNKLFRLFGIVQEKKGKKKDWVMEVNRNVLLVKKLSQYATLPVRVLSGSAGYDLSSACDVVVPALGKALCPTDLAIAVPPGTYGRIAARSGLALKNHINVGGGVIDPNYSGNVGVILYNHSETEFKVSVGDRIAQLILEKIVVDAPVQEVDEFPTAETERGSAGFGSTGIKSQVKKPKCEEYPCPVAYVDCSTWVAHNTSS